MVDCMAGIDDSGISGLCQQSFEQGRKVKGGELE